MSCYTFPAFSDTPPSHGFHTPAFPRKPLFFNGAILEGERVVRFIRMDSLVYENIARREAERHIARHKLVGVTAGVIPVGERPDAPVFEEGE